MLTTEDISEYQAIYQKVYGKSISRELAYEQGLKLVLLMQTITR